MASSKAEPSCKALGRARCAERGEAHRDEEPDLCLEKQLARLNGQSVARASKGLFHGPLQPAVVVP
jgi:hypothetical protein